MQFKEFKNIPVVLAILLIAFALAFFFSQFSPIPSITAPGNVVTGGCIGTARDPDGSCVEIREPRERTTTTTTTTGPPLATTPRINANKTFYEYNDTIFFTISGFRPSTNVNVSVNYPSISLVGGFQTNLLGAGGGDIFLGRNLPPYAGPATLEAVGLPFSTAQTTPLRATFNITLNLTAAATACPYSNNPVLGNVFLTPSNVTKGSLVAAATSGWGSICGNYTFAVRLPVVGDYCAGAVLCNGTLNGQGEGSCAFNANLDPGNYSNISACVDRNGNGNVLGVQENFGEQSNPTSLVVTAPVVPIFSASNFKCSARTDGYNCNVSYTHNYNENIIILFIVSDAQGNTVSSIAYTADAGSGLSRVNYFCVNGGNYYMSWEAYRESDQNLANQIAFSIPTDRQLMAC